MAFQDSEQRWRATVLSSAVLWPCYSFAQTPTVVDTLSKDATPLVSEASVSHAAAKGLTLKIGSVLKKVLIFSTGTGSVVSGGVLTNTTGTSLLASE